jgi:hypothetical protein
MKNALMLVAALALMAPMAHAAGTSIPAGKTVAQADQTPAPHKKKHKKKGKKGAQAPAGEATQAQ